MSPWQLLPPLTESEYAALKADIAEHGILVAPVVDAETGEVLDGHHRVKAWSELRAAGVRVPDYPRDVRRFGSDEDRIGFLLAANLFRRHLDHKQRAAVVTRLRERGWSLRRVSEALGVHHETVRRDLEGVADATGDASKSAIIVGRDQKTYPARRPKPVPSIVVRSARDEARARAALAALGDESPGPDLRRSEEKARLAALARRRSEDVPAQIEGPGWEIRTGDFREVLADIPDQSVDAIVTDPPYNVEGVPLYSDLSAFAARVLKPGRLCVTYCGKMALPEHFERLGEHLEYVWTGAIFLPGRHTVFRRKMIFGRWRPVAFFSAGQYEVRTTIVDALWAEGRGEKQPEDHPWQQAIGPFERLVEMAAKPGELVMDPFLGSGTTGLACIFAERQFIGCDVDSGAVTLSLARLSAARQAAGSTQTLGASDEPPASMPPCGKR
jgi:site-specific DNA-methyltransferase (adenine-specific)